jgi:superoxide dismutase
MLIKCLVQEADMEYHYDDYKNLILEKCNGIIEEAEQEQKSIDTIAYEKKADSPWAYF